MLNIGKDYVITSDGLNIIVSKRMVSKKANKKDRMQTVGYFSSLQNALEWLVDNEIKATGFKDLETVVAKQDELYQLIKGLNLKGVKP